MKLSELEIEYSVRFTPEREVEMEDGEIVTLPPEILKTYETVVDGMTYGMNFSTFPDTEVYIEVLAMQNYQHRQAFTRYLIEHGVLTDYDFVELEAWCRGEAVRPEDLREPRGNGVDRFDIG
jgi:hypothetical protein